MTERIEHSKFAVASTILPLAVWVYLLALFILWFKTEIFVKFTNQVFGNSFGALGVAVILFIFLFGVIPVGCHLAGIVLGAIGICSKNKKRIFGFIGLILNLLPLIAGSLLYVLGAASQEQQ